MTTILIITAIVLIVIISIYNYLIRLKNQANNIYSNVEVILKKRYDLLPNLFKITQAIMTHERELFKKVTDLRSLSLKEQDANTQIKLASQIQSPLQNILAAVENYPILKSNENVLQLQKQLFEIEEQISAVRRAYNQSVTDFNNAVEMFPTNILASLLNYQKKELYNAPDIVVKTTASELLKR